MSYTTRINYKRIPPRKVRGLIVLYACTPVFFLYTRFELLLFICFLRIFCLFDKFVKLVQSVCNFFYKFNRKFKEIHGYLLVSVVCDCLLFKHRCHWAIIQQVMIMARRLLDYCAAALSVAVRLNGAMIKLLDLWIVK